MTQEPSNILPKTFEKLVWDRLYTSERLAHYYPMYEAKLRKRHDWVVRASIGMAILAAAGLIVGLTFFQTWTTSFSLALTIGSIVSTVWAYRGDAVRNIALATIAASRWRHLSAQWRLLWADAYLGEARSIEQCRRLLEEERVIGLETECGSVDEKLNEKSASRARLTLEHIFYPNPGEVGVAGAPQDRKA